MCIRNIALVKHLNNLIEQDHRHIKRRFSKSAGFQSLRQASRTLKGIETIHAIYKQKRSLTKALKSCGFGKTSLNMSMILFNKIIEMLNKCNVSYAHKNRYISVF